MPKRSPGEPTREQQELGRRLKEAAKRAGFTSEAIARRLGNQDGTVRGWWRGRNRPSTDMLRAYASLVGVSADHLLFGEPGDRQMADTVIIDLSQVSNEELAAELQRRLVGRR